MKKVIARAPVNIALIKYWGKADEEKVLPTTTSLSLTLTDLYSETTFETGPFQFFLNDKPANEEEVKRVKDVLKHFRDQAVVIRSNNNFPTASGLASSASGFAALTVGLNQFYEANYTAKEIATLTRLGSGSACRSLVDGFAIWDKLGQLHSLENPFKNLVMIVMMVSEDKKAISSRVAMKVTKETSPIYQQWINDSENDYHEMLLAIKTSQFHQLGEIMERNSQRLHAVMASANPPIIYQQPTSLKLIELVKKARSEGLVGYVTMDAGPNVKILTQNSEISKWETYLRKNTTTKFLISRIGGKAYAK
jgi:diphosphomevalonate decarboxylase